MPFCCWSWRGSLKCGSRASDKASPAHSPERAAIAASAVTKPPEIKVSEALGYNYGNPRNKCALQPGHSLMDWIKLGTSGKDLSGMGGRVIAVSPKELAAHNQMENAWIAIRGRVYNITDYLEYHPGGPEELMRGAGKDATSLFDQVHAWVNYESLLSKCLIGPLRKNEISDEEFNDIFFSDSPKSQGKQKAPDILRKSMESLKSSNSNKSTSIDAKNSLSRSEFNKSSSESSLNVNETITSDPVISDDSTVKAIGDSNNVQPETSALKITIPTFKFPTLTLTKADSFKSDSSEAMIDGTSRQENAEKQCLPKFDWLQKTDTITLIFYTKPLCNPHCSVILPEGDDRDTEISVVFNYDFYTYRFDMSLEEPFVWPCSVVINHETGKVEVNLRKKTSKIWKLYGAINNSRISEQCITVDENSIPCCVMDKWDINHNTTVLLIRATINEHVTFPVGYHSRIFCTTDDSLSRSYTPVPPYMMSEFKPANWASDLVCLMVKKYDQGAVSTWLTSRELGNELIITRPLGSFSLKMLQDVSQMCLIAAGTGLTPMLSIIQFALQRRNPRSKRIDLLFFNRSEKDILWHDQLSALEKQDDRFHLTNILSEPTQLWEGTKSHINQAILMNHFSSVYLDKSRCTTQDVPSPIKKDIESIFQTNRKELFMCICGPSLFTQLTKNLLSGLGCSEEQMYGFFG